MPASAKPNSIELAIFIFSSDFLLVGLALVSVLRAADAVPASGQLSMTAGLAKPFGDSAARDAPARQSCHRPYSDPAIPAF
jgi:hypothetical protein